MAKATTTNDDDSKRQTLMLVDGYGLIFRAYHALPPTLGTARGEQTNAVFGFASMLLDVLRSQQPDYAIIALEGGRTFRHEAYEGYKAHRAEMPDDLRSQVERVRELVDALNLPIEQVAGYEADDVIGSLAHHCAASGLRVLVVTGDTDLLQLVGDDVEVILPGARRFGELRIFDTAAVEERYGFGPEYVPDYKALVGDTSDNIPGVPGIGDKTAKALIARFGGVEQILEHLPEVTPPRARTALEANAAQAIESKRLATIVCNLDIPCDLEHAALGNYDRERAIELFRELEFRTLAARLPEPRERAKPAPLAPAAPAVRTLVSEAEQLAAMVARMRATGEYALDVETTSTEPMLADLVGISIAVSPRESYYIPVGHSNGAQLHPDAVRAVLNPVFREAALRMYGHHAKYDIEVLQRHGYDTPNLAFDTMIAAYLLGENSVRLKDLAFTKLGIEMTEIVELIGTGRQQLTMDVVSLDDACQYACGDVEATFSLTEHFRPELAAHGLEALFYEIELPLVPVLIDMERAGIAVDVPYLTHLSEEITTRMAALEREIYALAGHELNINSTRQMATLLFEELKLPSGRRTKTGYSVDSDVLENLRALHPIVDAVLEYRTLGKLKSTYVDALPAQVNPETGRVHTSFNQTIAATGRLSSTNPNLQNIPIRTEIGRRVRRAFVADHRPPYRLFDDAVLLSADYSQIELRILADLSGDQFLIDAFRAGEDVHRATAAIVYGVPPAEITDDMRRVAKTVNFGVLYGMQAYGLSRDSGLSRAEAQAFIDQYWSRLPRVKQLFDETLRVGASAGFVQATSGRRRFLADLTSSNGARRLAAERAAVNMPIQGTAADIMKVAMIRVHRELRERKLRARMLLQVHDELVLEVDRPDLEATADVVLGTMEDAYQLAVPLAAEVKAGQNWEEMAPLPVPQRA